MALTSIINLVLVAIIIICAWQGYKKGIIMGIIEVLVIILSLYGAQLLSDTFSYEVISVVKPFISGYMENEVQTTTYTVLGYEPDENGEYLYITTSVTDLVSENPDSRREICLWCYKNLGIYDSIASDMADRTVEYADENSASLTSSVVSILCQAITWYGGFILFFIILFAVLTVIVNLPNLSFRLPYVGIINELGGLGIGVFTGFLFCAVICWVLQFTGLLLPEDTLRGAKVAAYFLDKDMLANYITF